jgi:hypothetical protein
MGPHLGSKTHTDRKQQIKKDCALLRMSARGTSSNTRSLPCRAPHRSRHLLAHILAFTSAATPLPTGLRGVGIFNLFCSIFWRTSSVDGATPHLLFRSSTYAKARHSSTCFKASVKAAGSSGSSRSHLCASTPRSHWTKRSSTKMSNSSPDRSGHRLFRPASCKNLLAGAAR